MTAASRTKPRLRLTDTTFRDGNQTLMRSRLKAEDLIPIAGRLDDIGFFAFEAFGGYTFEAYLHSGEDPWDYLRGFKAVTPKTPLQALVRGQNLVGHHNFADDVVELFIEHAAACGVDVFRIFDPLNDLRNIEVAVKVARRLKKRVQGVLCYAISPAHNLDLWCSLAKGLAKLGVHEIVIKDTSGLLSPQVTWELVTALTKTVKQPIVVHSHCSSGMAPMAYMAAIEAGASVLDTALSPLAWGTSLPATESVVGALAGGDYDTGLDLDRLGAAKDELAAVKDANEAHLSLVADRVDADILRYQLPGQMLEDIHHGLERHGAGGRLKEALAEVSAVRRDLGYPPLMAPIRWLIANQAVFNVVGGERYATVTQELKNYLQGLYGRPPVPADHEVRRLVLGRDEPITIRPADLLEPQLEGARAQLRKLGVKPETGSLLNFVLFPALATALFEGARRPASGDRSKAGAKQDVGAPQPAAEGTVAAPAAPPALPAAASAEFDVEVEGELFKVRVSGSGMSVGLAGGGAGGTASAAPSAPTSGTAVVAPMQGLIVKIPVKAGDAVKLGDVVAVLEAMKMQNDIVSTVAGKVSAVLVKEGDVVSPNQPLLSIA